MKTPRRKTSAGVPDESPDTAEKRVVEALEAIDQQSLEKLLQVRADQARLAGFRTKAADLKDNASEAVWQRVMDDYDAREATLNERATPLEIEVQKEYKKLQELANRLTSEHEETRLITEELQFREAVGELTPEELKKELAGPQAVIDAFQRDMAAIDEHRTRIREAFGSEAELEALMESEASTKVPKPPKSAASTRVPEGVSKGEAATKVPEMPSEAPDTDSTRVVPMDEHPPEDEAAGSDATLLLPSAAVLVTLADSDPAPQSLGPVNYIGRMEESQVPIARPGVSRQHAVIEFTLDRFFLKDLGSQNGTYLNGVRVTEQELTDGDLIVIGDAEIVFRLPWPPDSQT